MFHMNDITEILLTAVIIFAAVVGYFLIQQCLSRFKRRRLLMRLSGQPCPQCHQILGASILSDFAVSFYGRFVPEGVQHNLPDLPDETIRVYCPHCKAEHHFYDDGRLYETVEPRPAV